MQNSRSTSGLKMQEALAGVPHDTKCASMKPPLVTAVAVAVGKAEGGGVPPFDLANPESQPDPALVGGIHPKLFTDAKLPGDGRLWQQVGSISCFPKDVWTSQCEVYFAHSSKKLGAFEIISHL